MHVARASSAFGKDIAGAAWPVEKLNSGCLNLAAWFSQQLRRVIALRLRQSSHMTAPAAALPVRDAAAAGMAASGAGSVAGELLEMRATIHALAERKEGDEAALAQARAEISALQARALHLKVG